MENISLLPDEELMRRLEAFVEDERRRLQDFLAWLGELDRRAKAFTKCGYSSTFDYCRRRLGLSEDESYRRITAARATVVRPELLSAVADGRLTLSAISRIAPHIRRPEAPELISRAEGKSARQIDEILAPLNPVPPKPDLMREVVVATPFQEEARVHFSFYGPRALREAVERIKELMAHKHPFGALEDVLLDVATDWLMRNDPMAACTDRLPAAPGRSSSPAVVRRGVWRRDGGRCVFVGPGGVRCQSRRALELDHIVPLALGGKSIVDNMRLLCRPHNDVERRRILGEGTGPTSSGATPGSP